MAPAAWAFERFDLTGRSAVVTGGGTGLGYFTARGLARSGARVMIAARRESVLKEAADRLTAEADGNQVCYHPVDLADRGSCRSLADAAANELGTVDIFVGNAAQDCLEPLVSITDDSSIRCSRST